MFIVDLLEEDFILRVRDVEFVFGSVEKWFLVRGKEFIKSILNLVVLVIDEVYIIEIW